MSKPDAVEKVLLEWEEDLRFDRRPAPREVRISRLIAALRAARTHGYRGPVEFNGDAAILSALRGENK